MPTLILHLYQDILQKGSFKLQHCRNAKKDFKLTCDDIIVSSYEYNGICVHLRAGFRIHSDAKNVSKTALNVNFTTKGHSHKMFDVTFMKRGTTVL